MEKNDFSVTGKINRIEDIKMFGKTKSRTFILEFYDPRTERLNYPKFQLKGDMCELLNKFEVGEKVNVAFYLDGKFINECSHNFYCTAYVIEKVVRDGF